jgi:RNA polymerase sigma factor (sigma-70 family)
MFELPRTSHFYGRRESALEPEVRVFVIDDESSMRQALALLVRSIGIACDTFSSADEFLASYSPGTPGCLVLDIRLPGMSGLQLQETLAQRGITIPIIMITGHGTIQMAVRAVKAGAFDFLEKPFRDQDLLDRIQMAIRQDLANRAKQSRKGEIVGLMAALTSREREVLNLVVQGHSNKEIASQLGLSHKTIEYHRSKLMEKLQANSIPELVQLAMIARE